MRFENKKDGNRSMKNISQHDSMKSYRVNKILMLNCLRQTSFSKLRHMLTVTQTYVYL